MSHIGILVLSLVPGHLGGTSTARKDLVPCLGLKSGTLGGTARHESLFVPRRAVPIRAWAGSCRAAHLAIYRRTEGVLSPWGRQLFFLRGWRRQLLVKRRNEAGAPIHLLEGR